MIVKVFNLIPIGWPKRRVENEIAPLEEKS